MNAISVETDILNRLPERTLVVLRERALREEKPLLEVVRDVLNETAERIEGREPRPTAPKAA